MTHTQFRNESGTFDKYAWPGGYPIYYLMADSGILCADCANKETKLIAQADDTNDKQWQIEGRDINWEDPNMFCDHCSKRIESAYAEPETN